MIKYHYSFKNRVWRWTGETGSWYFINLSQDLVKDILKLKNEKRILFARNGLIKITACIGQTKFKTSLLGTKLPNGEKTYMIAINKKVRFIEEIEEGDLIKIDFEII